MEDQRALINMTFLHLWINEIYYGSMCLVKHPEMDELTADDFHEGNIFYDLRKDEWEKVYEWLFGGFEDLGEEDSEEEDDEEDNIPEHMKTKNGYLKDGFVVDDDEISDEDYVEINLKENVKVSNNNSELNDLED